MRLEREPCLVKVGGWLREEGCSSSASGARAILKDPDEAVQGLWRVDPALRVLAAHSFHPQPTELIRVQMKFCERRAVERADERADGGGGPQGWAGAWMKRAAIAQVGAREIERAQARKTEAHRERLTTRRAAEIVVGDVESAEHYTTRESSREGADSGLAECVAAQVQMRDSYCTARLERACQLAHEDGARSVAQDDVSEVQAAVEAVATSDLAGECTEIGIRCPSLAAESCAESGAREVQLGEPQLGCRALWLGRYGWVGACTRCKEGVHCPRIDRIACKVEAGQVVRRDKRLGKGDQLLITHLEMERRRRGG